MIMPLAQYIHYVLMENGTKQWTIIPTHILKGMLAIKPLNLTLLDHFFFPEEWA